MRIGHARLPNHPDKLVSQLNTGQRISENGQRKIEQRSVTHAAPGTRSQRLNAYNGGGERRLDGSVWRNRFLGGREGEKRLKRGLKEGLKRKAAIAARRENNRGGDQNRNEASVWRRGTRVLLGHRGQKRNVGWGRVGVGLSVTKR